MSSTRLCGYWLRSSFSLFVQSPISSILLAITFAAIATSQAAGGKTQVVVATQHAMVTNIVIVIASQSAVVTTQPRVTSQPAVVTTQPRVTSQPAVVVTTQPPVVTAALPIPSGSTVSTPLLTETLFSSATISSSNQISKISVFITVNSASPTPAAPPASTLPSTTKIKSKKGLAIGLGLGVPAICFLIILAIWLIIRHRHKKRANEEGKIPFIAESRGQPMKNSQESALPHELPDSKPALRELAEGRENPSLLASRTELPTNSPPLAEMRGD